MNKILILFLLILNISIAYGDIPIIESLPQRDHATIDIEIRKIKSVKLSAKIDKNNKIIEFIIGENEGANIALKNQENYNIAIMEDLKDISERKNFSYTIERINSSQGRVILRYEKVPKQLYVVILRNGKDFEKLFKVDLERAIETSLENKSFLERYEVIPNFLSKTVDVKLEEIENSNKIRWIPSADNPEEVEILLGEPTVKVLQKEKENGVFGISVENSNDGNLDLELYGENGKEYKGKATFFLKNISSGEEKTRFTLDSEIKELRTQLWVKMQLKDFILAKDLKFGKKVKLYLAPEKVTKNLDIKNSILFLDVPNVFVNYQGNLIHVDVLILRFYKYETNLNDYLIDSRLYLDGFGNYKDIDINLGNILVRETFGTNREKVSSAISIGGIRREPNIFAPGKITPDNKIKFGVTNGNVPQGIAYLQVKNVVDKLVVLEENGFIKGAHSFSQNSYDRIEVDLRMKISADEIKKIVEGNYSESNGYIEVPYSENAFITLLGSKLDNDSYELTRGILGSLNNVKLDFPKIYLTKNIDKEENRATLNFKTSYIPGTDVYFDENGKSDNNSVITNIQSSGFTNGFKEQSQINVFNGNQSIEILSANQLGTTEYKEITLTDGTVIKIGFIEGRLKTSLVKWQGVKEQVIKLVHTQEKNGVLKTIENIITYSTPLAYLEIINNGMLDFGFITPKDLFPKKSTSDIEIKTNKNITDLKVNTIKVDGTIQNQAILVNEQNPEETMIVENIEVDDINSITEDANYKYKKFKLSGQIDKINPNVGKYRGSIDLEVKLTY